MFYWLKIYLLDFKLQLHISALGVTLNSQAYATVERLKCNSKFSFK